MRGASLGGEDSGKVRVDRCLSCMMDRRMRMERYTWVRALPPSTLKLMF
jgi:ribosomal protein L37E